MDDYDTWENKITEHDSLAKEPAQESVLATCLYSSTSGALREHLDLHPDKCNDWDDLRVSPTTTLPRRTRNLMPALQKLL